MTGKVPMPLDVMIQYKNGNRELAYIPQYLMFGEKPVEDKSVPRISFEPWKWTNPTYTIELNHKLTEFKSVEIEPTKRIADVNRENNRLELNG